ALHYSLRPTRSLRIARCLVPRCPLSPYTTLFRAGSGKSNVVDAIAWVLGAQAPSSVRSQKMDDVIFAGTSKRTALGRAEVALTLDRKGTRLNSSHVKTSYAVFCLEKKKGLMIDQS